MATGTGLEAQLGMAIETTNGTPVVVTRFLPFKSESVVAERTPVVSQGIIAGRLTYDTEQHKLGVQKVAGSVELDLYRENQAIIWQAAIGSLTSTSSAGSAPYTHTAAFADVLPSFTLQKGVPEADGGTTAFTYGGCKIQSWTLTGNQGDTATLKFDVVGAVVETTGTALASATFANNAAVPFIFTQGSATVGGATVPTSGFEINCANKLALREYAGDAITREPLREGRVEIGGKVSVEFNATTQWAQWAAGTDIDIVLAFSDGVNSVTVTVHTILTGSTPSVSSTGVVMHDLTWANAYGDSTDADALQVVIVNSGSITP